MSALRKIIAITTLSVFAGFGIAEAQPVDQINLRYSVEQQGAVKAIAIDTGYSVVPIPITGDPPMSTLVDPTSVDRQPASIVVEWTDGSLTSFPLFLISSFTGRAVDVFLSQEKVDIGNVSSIVDANCNGDKQSNLREAFKTIYICGSAVKALSGEKWTGLYKRAVNGWFIANYALYTRASTDHPFSPYGLQPELVARLEEVLTRIDNGSPASNFLPLRVPDIKKALQEHITQDIRMARVVPQLIQQNRLDQAQAVNQLALESYKKITKNSRNKVLDGVTANTFERNSDYIGTRLIVAEKEKTDVGAFLQQ